MKTKIILLIAMVGLSATTMAQTQGDSLMYQAYLKHSKTLWNAALHYYDQSTEKEAAWEKGLAYYGLLNNTMGKNNDEETFEANFDQAVDYLEKLEENGNHAGEAKALQSSIYGLAMAYHPEKGIVFGPESSQLMGEALREAPQSPIVWKMKAGSLFFTPEAYGGDKAKALEAYTKSIGLFEQASLSQNWLYLDALAFKGLNCQALGKKEEARETFDKALQQEPNFNWVKYSLKPALDQ